MKDGQYTNGCFFIISEKCGPLQSNVHVDSFSRTKYLIFELRTMHTRAWCAPKKCIRPFPFGRGYVGFAKICSRFTGRQKHTDLIFNYKKKNHSTELHFFVIKTVIQKRPVRSLLLPAEILGVQSYLSAAVETNKPDLSMAGAARKWRRSS